MPVGGAITLNGNVKHHNLEKLKALRWCGISNRNEVNYQVNQLGWNYYMNEFSAAIGIEQLKKLNKMNAIRKAIASRYNKELKINDKMLFNKDCSYHLFWIQSKNRNRIRKQLLEKGIETGTNYKPIHQRSINRKKIELKNNEGSFKVDDIYKKDIESTLYTSHLPKSSPDMILRTSGENRLSGVLLWQSAYSELISMDIL